MNPGDGSGRGSFVYFSQASLFTEPETGYTTAKGAKTAKAPLKRNHGNDASAAFLMRGTKVPIPPQF